MGPAFYVIAILGCGEADAACQQVSVADAVYQSVDACNAATADALAEHVDLAFPVVVAQCMPGDSKISYKILPGEVDLPEPDRDQRSRPSSQKKQLAAR